MSEAEMNSKITPDNLDEFLPNSIINLLGNRDGVAKLIDVLPTEYPPEDIAYDIDGKGKTEQHRIWELIGFKLLKENRLHEAIQVFSALYRSLLKAQFDLDRRFHKGVPLVWIHVCYKFLNFPVHAKRYLMLTFCEDVISSKGNIDPNNSGVYFRLVWEYGLPNKEFIRYQNLIYSHYEESPNECLFPEWMLQNIDNDWMIEIPSAQESQNYIANTEYINYLFQKLGSGSGTELEILADYLLSCIAGCRTMRRAKSHSTDYDVVCSLDGIDTDFRSEFGRYFIVECKDWERTADFSTVAKFCRVLDSAKCKLGILFSKKGISGQEDTDKPKNAYREIIKIYQDRGITMIVINNDDIMKLMDGHNFIVMLRSKYDEIRLDLKNQTIY